MATIKTGFLVRGLLAIIFGIVGGVVGNLIISTALFPTLAWQEILVVLGLLVGLFAPEINEAFGKVLD